MKIDNKEIKRPLRSILRKIKQNKGTELCWGGWYYFRLYEEVTFKTVNELASNQVICPEIKTF